MQIIYLKNFVVLIFVIIFLSAYSCKKEKFIITLTSWKSRIKLIYKNLENILINNKKAKKIILNLSIEEFPNKNKELPITLLNLLKKYRNFEIFWVKKNTNVFKKLIPTINRFKNDIIISLDDDILYPNNTIKNMLKCYNKIGNNNPISFGTFTSDWNINGTIINSHYGGGSLVKYEYYNNKINEIYLNTTVERINKGIKCPDDILYTYAALANGYKYIRCKDFYIDFRYVKHNLQKPFSNHNSKKFNILSERYHKIIRSYIENVYNLKIEDLIKNIKKKK